MINEANDHPRHATDAKHIQSRPEHPRDIIVIGWGNDSKTSRHDDTFNIPSTYINRIIAYTYNVHQFF